MTGVVVEVRPRPAEPRRYRFPDVVRGRLSNGLAIVSAHLPGRPLVTATVVLRNGAVDEPAAHAGATVLAARALAEGTRRHDAIALVEASERLGTSLHAEAGWDSTSAGLEVTAGRIEPALALLAEMIAEPTFPAPEVERLRDERLNDLLQAAADPRRRADEAFVDTIYTADSPYHRPAGGLRDTVAPLTDEDLRLAWARGMDPARMALVIGGDLDGLDVARIAERLFGSWRPLPGIVGSEAIVAAPALDGRIVRLIDRPGAVQTEIRIGHPGVPRRTPDFHAVSVMSTILGGIFTSRLNRNLREDKGYTYGAGAGFEMRRAAGPFVARAAVNTAVTVPAIREILRELDRIRSDAVDADELATATDFLVGVFPLRFETPGPVVGAVAGLVVHDLPDDELATYRDRIAAVTADDVLAAARTRIDPDRAGIVLVGDAAAIGGAEALAEFGPVTIVRDGEATED